MALFNYTGVDQTGAQRQGTIDAVNMDVAITALQRRGLVVSSVDPAKSALLQQNIKLFSHVSNRDIVMLSRQMTTLFEAQVSALRAFRLLASEARTPELADKLTAISNDIQSGMSISSALERHPDVFSPFYVNMVRAGEEAGKLNETFSFLADYLDRNYEITTKARNALVYPVFVVVTFVVVMILMMTMVIPRLASILGEVGQNVPVYTRIVIGISMFMSDYILFIGVLFVVGGIVFYRYAQTENGRLVVSRARLQIPVIGNIYQKLYLSRIVDNLSTMLKSGIQMVRSLEITSTVVGDASYEKILMAATKDVQSGIPASEALRKYPEIPGIIVAMMKIGEETGNLSEILDVIGRFYRREVNNAIDTLVGLIEPFMIVMLALGVGFLLLAVLTPIYNISSGL